jgi:hypothetical protein
LEASAVLGIALWRSCFAGLITMLPALLLQLAGLCVMTRCANWGSAAWLKGSMVCRLALGLLLIPVLAAAAGQTWATVDASSRTELVRMSFSPEKSCTFDLTKIAGLTGQVDAAVAASGRAVRSSVVVDIPTRIDLVLPYGGGFRDYLRELMAPVSSLTVCKIADASPRVQVRGIKMVSGLGVIPLNLLALVATMLTAVLLARMLAQTNLLSALAMGDGAGLAIGSRLG